MQSVRGQSYTHWVDLSAVDSAGSLLPPGADEGPDGNSTGQASLWETGSLKPAPLSETEVAALAFSVEEL